MSQLIKQDVYLFLIQNGNKINVYVMKDSLRLAYNVYAMAYRLVIFVIDVPIRQILHGMVTYVNVYLVILKLMKNVILILLV